MIYTFSIKKANIHSINMQIMEPAFLILRGIISATTTKGNVSTPQHAINITNEKLAIGIHENDLSTNPMVFKYIEAPRQTKPIPVPIADIISKTFRDNYKEFVIINKASITLEKFAGKHDLIDFNLTLLWDRENFCFVNLI